MRNHSGTLFAVTAAVAGFACGGAVADGNERTEGGAAGEDGAGAGGETSGNDGGAAGAPLDEFVVTVEQFGSGHASVEINFDESVPLGPFDASACEVTRAGVCTTTTCPKPSGPGQLHGSLGPLKPMTHAGTVRVRDHTAGTTLATLVPHGDEYPVPSIPDLVAGDAIEFDASGDPTGVGPFSLTVIAPIPVDPFPKNGQGVVPFNLTRDRTLKWTAGKSGRVTVTLAIGPSLPQSVGTVCTFAADSGGGTLSATALAPYLPYVGERGSYAVVQESSAATTASGVPVKAWIVDARDGSNELVFSDDD